MRMMLLLALASCSILACSSQEPASVNEGSLYVPLLLQEREAALYYFTKDEFLKIEVSSIEDSRCPSDVKCVRQSYARVTFKIEGLTEPVKLFVPALAVLDPGATDNFSIPLNGRTYKITLKNVTPYPSTTNHVQIKSAEFVLENR